MKLQDYKTWELVEELKKREGVQTMIAATPDSMYYCAVINENKPLKRADDTGPATILIVID